MKWENILKVQVLGNKQKVKMGNIPIPTEEDNNCKEQLVEFILNARQKNQLDSHPLLNYYDKIAFDEIPEKTACKLVDYINNYNYEDYDTSKYSYIKRESIDNYDINIGFMIYRKSKDSEAETTAKFSCSIYNTFNSLSAFYASAMMGVEGSDGQDLDTINIFKELDWRK